MVPMVEHRKDTKKYKFKKNYIFFMKDRSNIKQAWRSYQWAYTKKT